MNISKNNKNVGSVVISDDVIAKIATVAAKDVSGVFDVKPNIAKISKIITKQKEETAVEISRTSDGQINIEISVILNDGAKIKETSEQIQAAIKSSVQGMTSTQVNKVNVIIADINLPETENTEDK